jgi:folate-binding protein YgfZ
LRYGRDITEDMTLPETGLDRISASETKGCYPGQEVVARTNTYHGHAKKIVRVEFEKSAGAAAGDKFFVEGKEAGWLTSVSVPPSAEKGRGLGYALKGYFDAPLDVRIGAAAAKGRIFPD